MYNLGGYKPWLSHFPDKNTEISVQRSHILPDWPNNYIISAKKHQFRHTWLEFPFILTYISYVFSLGEGTTWPLGNNMAVAFVSFSSKKNIWKTYDIETYDMTS